MKTKTVIKPCPFCGSKLSKIKKTRKNLYYVQCDDCGARRFLHDECEGNAIRHWDQRSGDHQPVPHKTGSAKGVGGKTITLTKPEINHLFGLLQTNERTQEYTSPREQYWKRHLHIRDKLSFA
jgi:DNA-directed RNA polymerase subunit RPC12/RpoP